MKFSCAVCGRERDEEKMRIFSPTGKEKEVLKKMGEAEPKDRYAYCQSCIRILSNPVTAIPLMQGIIQIQARALGATTQDAERIANKFGKKMLEATPKNPRS